MNILKKTPSKTFNKTKFELDLQKNNIVKDIRFKPQNSSYCHKNKNNETVIQLSDRLYAVQPKNITLKRNFFLTLKKVYNNNLLYSTILSKRLYKIRFNDFMKFLYHNENETKIVGRVLPIGLFEKYTANVGILGHKSKISLFELTPRVMRLKNVNKIISFYLNKVFYFNIKKVIGKNNNEKLEFSRRTYFLKNKTS